MPGRRLRPAPMETSQEQLKYDPRIHHRQSIRLKGHDYSSPGAYFVTICAQNRECVFGEIVDGEMRLNEWGNIVAEEWQALPGRFGHVELDAFVLMPNHAHGVVVIVVDHRRGAVTATNAPNAPNTTNAPNASPGGETPPLRRETLGNIVAFFKYQTTKRINGTRGTPGVPVWQRNYYEHIARNERELNAIRRYIRNNPLQWELDRDNLQNTRRLPPPATADDYLAELS